MKAEHRHDSKTNELAEWLQNLPELAKKNVKILTYASVVIVLIAVSAWFHWHFKNESVQKKTEFTGFVTQLSQNKAQIIQSSSEGKDLSFMLLQTAEALLNTAQNEKDDGVAAMAFIKHGETIRTELHYRNETISEQELATQIEKAKSSYDEAVKRSKGRASLTAMAKFGLGLCEEELGKFDSAAAIYRQIAEDPSFDGTVTAVQAKDRLDSMDEYKQKLTFKASPKPEPVSVLPPGTEQQSLTAPLPPITSPPAEPNSPKAPGM